jgi:hypothetical protein
VHCSPVMLFFLFFLQSIVFSAIFVDGLDFYLYLFEAWRQFKSSEPIRIKCCVIQFPPHRRYCVPITKTNQSSSFSASCCIYRIKVWRSI